MFIVFWLYLCSDLPDKVFIDLTTLDACTYVRALVGSTGFLCYLDTETTLCNDATEGSVFIVDTCRKNIGLTFAWNGIKCT